MVYRGHFIEIKLKFLSNYWITHKILKDKRELYNFGITKSYKRKPRFKREYEYCRLIYASDLTVKVINQGTIAWKY